VTSTDSTPVARSRLPPVHRRPRPAGASSPPEALRTAVAEDGFVRLGLHESTQAELEGVAEVYVLHPLAVEDAVEAHQRPKLDSYDDSLFMVLKTARYVEHDALTARGRRRGARGLGVQLVPQR
jgi:magnesium transporter